MKQKGMVIAMKELELKYGCNPNQKAQDFSGMNGMLGTAAKRLAIQTISGLLMWNHAVQLTGCL